jgi:recombination protein RecA
MFGSPETTPGGRALKFYASVRLDIRRTSTIKGADNFDQGIQVKVKVVKNKMAAPFRSAEFDIMFNEGISRTGALVDLGIEGGMIEKKGPWLSYKGKRFQGREAAKAELSGDPVLLEELEALIIKAHEEKFGMSLSGKGK